MADEQNDSPAFRLRPRRAEPKSYYTVRLEYSANPAAFTRVDRPRAGAKRRSTPSQRNKTSYAQRKHQKQGAISSGGGRYGQNKGANSGQLYDTYGQAVGPPPPPIRAPIIMTKEEIELEEKRKQLRRNTAQSITVNTPVSPFLQRIDVEDLKPSSVYGQNYVSLQVIDVLKQQRHNNNNNNNQMGGNNSAASSDSNFLHCRCVGLTPEDSSKMIDVELYDDYARESLIKNGIVMNVAKFTTGPMIESTLRSRSSSSSSHHVASGHTIDGGDQDDNADDESAELGSEHKDSSSDFKVATDVNGKRRDTTASNGRSTARDSSGARSSGGHMGFSVIVKNYDDHDDDDDDDDSAAVGQVSTSGQQQGDERQKRAGRLISFVSIIDEVEQPTEPFVESSPPTPEPEQQTATFQPSARSSDGNKVEKQEIV